MLFKKKGSGARELGSYAQRAQFGDDSEILSQIGAKFYDEQEGKSENLAGNFYEQEFGANSAQKPNSGANSARTANTAPKQNSQNSQNSPKFSKPRNFRKIESPFKKIAIALCGLVAIAYAGFFLYDVLFGKRSLEVLRDLQKQKAFLFSDIERLKSENAELQKTYLERRLLDPDLVK
ncbi:MULTISPECIES: FtsB family cell division protein [unclassified Campylobacter]|uniref:FtsB family cell division protein n=1 Tax=unclassified Campylobacter TaxID=2593542 RepID=UPI0022EA01D4|nr:MULTISPECIES: hypothetical protein [unclassified Campylobacter]MDA3054402.1 hypothetical protein [Campylobacter sp. VBCF_07 NA4]MDA3060812.1 hypothetical protein [Campylobacter sp. VBCF_02 NA5]MDA3069921.1 hypothetical protein [Campylobacter sp. VBCF_08 NA3]WBR54361.1 hypothetical protein PF027_00410 [Campylobacter sp. VBCF_01 NA2]